MSDCTSCKHNNKKISDLPCKNCDEYNEFAPIGKKYDAEKLRWDLLPIEPIEEIVKAYTFGAKKYSANNWQNVNNFKDRYYAALMRHLAEWRKGRIFDDESKLRHLAHAAWNINALLWKELKEYEEGNSD